MAKRKILENDPEEQTPVLPKKSAGMQIFISYRTAEPDLSLAGDLHQALTTVGHSVFMAAESIDWGENWVDRIDQELKRCDYFVLLLSERSTTSDMVAGEVRTAKRLRDQLGKPAILPIRLNLPLDDPLNYELRSTLQTCRHLEAIFLGELVGSWVAYGQGLMWWQRTSCF